MDTGHEIHAIGVPGCGLAITIHTLGYLLLTGTIARVFYKWPVIVAKSMARFGLGGRTHRYRWIDAVLSLLELAAQIRHLRWNDGEDDRRWVHRV